MRLISGLGLLLCLAPVGCLKKSDEAETSAAPQASVAKALLVITADVARLTVFVDPSSCYGGTQGPVGELDDSGKGAFEVPVGQRTISLCKMTSSHSYVAKEFKVTVEAGKTTELKADLRKNLDADNCELYVDGFAKFYSYNQGWSRYKMHSEVFVSKPASTVGQWIRYRDSASGKEFTQMVTGTPAGGVNPTSPGKWIIEYAFAGTDTQPQGKFDYEVLDFSYYADMFDSKLMPVRYWVSGHGKNFSYGETMREPNYIENFGKTTVTWSNQDGPLFAQKKSCVR